MEARVSVGACVEIECVAARPECLNSSYWFPCHYGRPELAAGQYGEEIRLENYLAVRHHIPVRALPCVFDMARDSMTG